MNDGVTHQPKAEQDAPIRVTRPLLAIWHAIEVFVEQVIQREEPD